MKPTFAVLGIMTVLILASLVCHRSPKYCGLFVVSMLMGANLVGLFLMNRK